MTITILIIHLYVCMERNLTIWLLKMPLLFTTTSSAATSSSTSDRIHFGYKNIYLFSYLYVDKTFLCPKKAL